MRRYLFFLFLTTTLLALASCTRRQTTEQTKALQARLESKRKPEYVTDGKQSTHLWKTLQNFYMGRGHRFAWVKRNWIGKTVPQPQLEHLIKAIKKAEGEGLDPADYDLDKIVSQPDELFRNPRSSSDPVRVADFDLWLTYTFLKYGSHLLAGRFDPKRLDAHWQTKPRKVDFSNLLETALQENRIEQALEQLAPQYPEYAALQQALAHYRDIAAKGGWSKVPEDLVLKEGDNSPYVFVLRNNLAVTGDLGQVGQAMKQNEGNSLFDEALEEAARRFEARHGLKVDGVVDPEMVAAMNVPVARRIRQIELNMERLRWLPDQLRRRHIRVNIPDYRLNIFEDDKIVMTMCVVVGKTDNPTPIFSDQMTHVVFSPYWNIPESIATKEILPKILKDPGYLTRQNIQVVRKGSEAGAQVLDPATIDWAQAAKDLEFFPYTFRQRPGPSNALGGVKFIFPNQFNVYLHDTPEGHLFHRLERYFSHGCVRVERPIDLASYLLRGQPEWRPERISAAMQSGEQKTVPLKEPLPVHLVYWTAWVNKDGSIQFRQDIYGRDQSQDHLLSKFSKLRKFTKLAKESGFEKSSR